MRVERLSEEFDVEFEAFAFELRPGIPPEGMAREEASRGRVYPPGYLDNMRQMAADSGIDMKRPAIIPNTRKAHEATEFAKDGGALLKRLENLLGQLPSVRSLSHPGETHLSGRQYSFPDEIATGGELLALVRTAA